MRKRLLTFGGCLSAIVLSTMIVVNSADANGRKNKPPKPVPEPISYALFAAGGSALVGLRYLRSKWKSKELAGQQNDAKDGIS
ncbi:MAG: hypothetical protein DCC43_11400 [Candidatus Brocadia sp.]|uniref:PEP-CTERM protein-sorting domain-containing protein n=1 Tax=Candidatus Brocadia fulgida TaxID=380242 RepID=A0A0M2UU95_9BACT|nr:MAG: hypothetical protein BROFUL_01648 [Candidatus Brocadia fulgida]MCC6324968.1 PEP-CTERM sorting domain-containing protein [Candidatus Brocadia sp.]MCE7910722.1 PEP-CTERM sorting domain-containing protein [Candidatus Brocadia sp. AMX3]OQZ01750.1 MAG: hypothetical protein B6D35_02200 [Candidatus Brocadia sp. UTAMX2]MBV6518841.1 hypothetical protein [Candidatus Brocadia fulgida]